MYAMRLIVQVGYAARLTGGDAPPGPLV